MKSIQKVLPKLRVYLFAAFLAGSAYAEPLKIGYSDWPGFTIFELA